MTPTLAGRWQTRLLLFLVIGLPITFFYGLHLNGWFWPAMTEPFVFLAALLILGLVLDIAYIQLQRFRWDNDWPFAFQFFCSVVEFFLTYAIMLVGLLDPFLGARIPFANAALHFSLVFVPSFIAVLCGLQIFFLHWRFDGGEIVRPSGN